MYPLCVLRDTDTKIILMQVFDAQIVLETEGLRSEEALGGIGSGAL